MRKEVNKYSDFLVLVIIHLHVAAYKFMAYTLVWPCLVFITLATATFISPLQYSAGPSTNGAVYFPPSPNVQ